MQCAECVLCLVCVSQCPCHHLPLCEGQVEPLPPAHSAGELASFLLPSHKDLWISHVTDQQLQFYVGCTGLSSQQWIGDNEIQRGCFHKEGPRCSKTQDKKRAFSTLRQFPELSLLRYLWESCGEPLSPEGLSQRRMRPSPSLRWLAYSEVSEAEEK